MKSLSTVNAQNKANDDNEDIDSSIISTQNQEQYELAKYQQWKEKQIKTKEYIPRSDFHTPRTLEDFKNWNIKQEHLTKHKQLQHQSIKAEEELRSHDLIRGGHIVQALRVPDPQTPSESANNLSVTDQSFDSSLALSGQHKFDFAGEPTYVIEGTKFFEYYVQKYGYYFTTGFIKTSALTAMGLYLCLYQNWVTQGDIVEFLQAVKPFSGSTMSIAQSSSLYDVWWNTFMGSCITPMIVTAGIYAKCKGEWWEYKELKKEPLDSADLKTDVMTLQDKKGISSNKIIYEIALIKERRKERMNALAPLKDVVDVAETFSPHRNRGLDSGGGIPFSPKRMVEKGMKLRKFVRRHGIGEGLALYMSTSYSVMDPRRAGATQNFGLLKLQTRLDEFGRVIPGWQRQNSKLFIVPTIAIFLFFPPFGDWLFGWTL